MSVYTPLTGLQVARFAAEFRLGQVIAWTGIADGIDNSHFALTTERGEFVLTVFESLGFSAVAAVLALQNRLAAAGLPVPTGCSRYGGGNLGALREKPVIVCRRLPGQALTVADPVACRQVGAHLAQMHCVTEGYRTELPHVDEVARCRQRYRSLQAFLTVEECGLIADELAFQANYESIALPGGVIHGDLFRDNALFHRQTLTGMLDFYDAGHGALLFDLAVAVNDWCRRDATIVPANKSALLGGYERVRSLTPGEADLLPVYLRVAALRFWLSRRVRQVFAKAGPLTVCKDPLEFKNLLLHHRSTASERFAVRGRHT